MGSLLRIGQPNIRPKLQRARPAQRNDFSPNVKTSYDVSKVVALGLEYDGSTGPFFHYYPIRNQEHQLFIATDLNFNADWEFNAGYGFGLTNETDKSIFKVILWRRF